MTALLGDRAQQPGCQGGEFQPLQLRHRPLAEESLQTGLIDRGQGLRHEAQDKARKRGAAAAVAQPVGHQGGEINLAQPRLDRLGREEIRLDEFAEVLRDAVVIARHDRGVRDRQTQRSAKQGNDGIPVGQPAHRSCRREGRDIPPGPVKRLVVPRYDEQRSGCQQQQRRRELDPPQRTGTRRVAVQRLAHTPSFTMPSIRYHDGQTQLAAGRFAP